MKEPMFSGPSTKKVVTAISHDLDQLGFVVGKEFIHGPRCSGRTTRLLREALHQLDFMDPGDEIWVITDRWSNAKRLCEHVNNKLAPEMGFKGEKFLGDNHNQKALHGWQKSEDGLNLYRYFLTFDGDRHIHFCTVDNLPRQLTGRRLTYSPSIFFEHICYEFGAIENAEFDLYATLQAVG